MKHAFYVCQGRTIFGMGSTPDDAVRDARQWVDGDSLATLNAADMPRVSGARNASGTSWPAAKMMTNVGELNDRDLVIFDAESAAAYGIEDLE